MYRGTDRTAGPPPSDCSSALVLWSLCDEDGSESGLSESNGCFRGLSFVETKPSGSGSGCSSPLLAELAGTCVHSQARSMET